MRIVFLGTPDFAIPALRALHESSHEVVLVITRPSRPVGRRKISTPPPVYRAALELALPCLQPQNVNSDRGLAAIRAAEPDALVSVAYGSFLKSEILSLAPHGVLNLHPSRLPRYRGASPVQAAIAAGATETGVTVLLTDEGWDSGPVYAIESIAIGPHETAPELSDRLAVAGAALLVRTLDQIEPGEIEPTPQDESLATMTSPLTRDDADVDWSPPAPTIYNRYRAHLPWPGTRTVAAGRLLKILRSRPRPESIEAAPGTPALIDGRLLVACGEGCLEILEIQPEGRNPMPAAEFLLGYGSLLDHRWGP